MIAFAAILAVAANAAPIGEARAALADGLPAVAVQKLESTPSLAVDPAAAVLLARAYFEDAQPARALEILEPLSRMPETEFWRAQSFAALGRYSEALAAYNLASQAAEFRAQSVLGAARMLRASGRARESVELLASEKFEGPLAVMAVLESAEAQLDLYDAAAARAILDGITPSDKATTSRRNFLQARACAMAGNDAEAIRLFASLSPTDAGMAVAAVVGQANSLVRAGQIPAAETLVEEFISKNANLPGLPEMFALLDKIYSQEESPESGELKRWSADSQASPRRQLAFFYRAKFEERLGQHERADQLMRDAIDEGPDTDTGLLAAIELAKIRLKQGRGQDALGILTTLSRSPEADFLRGLALASLGRYADAVAAFLAASEYPPLAEPALANASWCELLSGENNRTVFENFQQRFPASPKIGLYRLHEAYWGARQGDPSAAVTLEKLASGRDAAVTGPSALALAEWKFLNNDRAGAGSDLRRISTIAPDDSAKADVLTVFLADDGTDGDAAIRAAEKFLASHAGSPSEPEVRMKLGELLYRRGNFADARVQLESLAGKFPGSPYEMPALFLAAESAARLQTATSANDAMILYEQVAASNGPLALRARLQQAILQNILGKPGEALVLFDKVLASSPDPEIRAAALMEKAKTQLAMGKKESAAALDILRGLAGDESLSPAWRNQAHVRIGAAYEAMGDNDSAVAAYYDALKSGQGEPTEYFWYYKAGFSAARLLEEAKRWEQAIRVYEMVAEAKGPRSEEAIARINKIRLENFLWEDKSAN